MTTIFQPNKKFWGIKVEEVYAGDYIIWKLQIKNPFRKNDKSNKNKKKIK